MRPAISLLFRGLLLTALLLMPAFTANSNARSPKSRATLASLTIEVRLRKLHLVRPDLIPYPIETEVYC